MMIFYELNPRNSAKAQFSKIKSAKKLELIDTDAHAQHIFKTNQSEHLSTLIIDFLSSP